MRLLPLAPGAFSEAVTTLRDILQLYALYHRYLKAVEPQQQHMDPIQGEDGASGDVAGLSASVSPLEVPGEPALREDQIQNAVSFLSHPKVRGSAETAKRTFLEKKGLTAAEIDEAFKRVPAEAPAVPAAATSSTPTVGANNLVTYTQQPQQAMQAPHHTTQVPSQALVPAQQMQMMQPQRPPVHWSQVVLGLGVAAAGVYGLHQLLAPRLAAWSHQLFSSRKAAAEAEAERTAALTAALERLSEGQSRLQETLESLTAAVKQQQQRGFAESQAEYLAVQSPSLGKMGQHQQQQHFSAGLGSSYYGRDVPQTMDTYASSSRAAAMRGGSSWDPYAPDSSYRPASAGRPGSATSPSGSGHNPAAAAGGPSGFYGSSATGFEVTPPPMGNYRAPQPPAQYGGGSSANKTAGPSGVDPGYARRAGAYAGPEESASASATARPEEAPRSAAFHEVMAMVQAGITPPNVRTDIDDNPPDPSRPLSAPQMPPRAKPWEEGTVSSNGIGTPGAAFSSSNVVADGPSGFGVRGYGGAGPVTPTSAPHAGSSGPASTGAASGAGDIGIGVSGKPAVGYDLSQLLGVDATRDAPWRPPPPPAATVQRPLSSGSTTNKQQLAGAESAPPVAPAERDTHPAALPTAVSAPPEVSAVADGLPVAAAEAAAVVARDVPVVDNVQHEA